MILRCYAGTSIVNIDAAVLNFLAHNTLFIGDLSINAASSPRHGGVIKTLFIRGCTFASRILINCFAATAASNDNLSLKFYSNRMLSPNQSDMLISYNNCSFSQIIVEDFAGSSENTFANGIQIFPLDPSLNQIPLVNSLTTVYHIFLKNCKVAAIP